MKELLCFVAGFAILAASGVQAQGARNCGPRDAIVKHLETRFGESRQAMGLAGTTGVMEVYASDETGSWTITLTMPNGMTCLMASGRAYETLAEALEPARGEPL